jgi:hypothetical protein
MEVHQLHQKTFRKLYKSKRKKNIQMTDYHKIYLALAIAYLRSRNKYLRDGCAWVPTSSGNTNVALTMQQYREEMK